LSIFHAEHDFGQRKVVIHLKEIIGTLTPIKYLRLSTAKLKGRALTTPSSVPFGQFSPIYKVANYPSRQSRLEKTELSGLMYSVCTVA